MIAGLTIALLLAAAAALYRFSPLGLCRVALEGEFQMRITVEGQELTSTMENNTPLRRCAACCARGPRRSGCGTTAR